MPDPNHSRNVPPPELDDALILQAMQGSETALAAIYDAYAQRIYRYCYSRVDNPAEADDLTAQTFLKVIEALPRYRHSSHFTAWIFQIARNAVMDLFRRNHRQHAGDAGSQTLDSLADSALEKAINAAPVDEQVIQAQAVAALRRHIRALDEPERELLRLRFVGDLTYAEIAALLGRKEDAVRKSLNRLLERLHWQVEVNHA